MGHIGCISKIRLFTVNQVHSLVFEIPRKLGVFTRKRERLKGHTLIADSYFNILFEKAPLKKKCVCTEGTFTANIIYCARIRNFGLAKTPTRPKDGKLSAFLILSQVSVLILS